MPGLIVFVTFTGGIWLLELIPHCEKDVFKMFGLGLLN